MQSLMGHLAQFSSFISQGEVLCTQSLAYLLEDTDAESAFRKLIGATATFPIDTHLKWHPEKRQADLGRPDLEGCLQDETPVVKIEAKLSAAFGEDQLESYAKDLGVRTRSGVVLLLVPKQFEEEAADEVFRVFAMPKPGPWRLRDQPGIAVSVLTWEEVLGALDAVRSQGFECDFAQFRAMYRKLNGGHIEPLTSDAEALAWRDKELEWIKRIDRVTRRLTPRGRLGPFGIDYQPKYYRRYVCRNIGSIESCFSIGVCDPFASYVTPIWLRFAEGTGIFGDISAHLTASDLSGRIVPSSNHLWIPLDVLKNAQEEDMIQDLISQVKRVTRIAYGE